MLKFPDAALKALHVCVVLVVLQCGHGEVFGAVVIPDAVHVMDDLVAFQGSSEELFHDDAVLVSIPFLANTDHHVSIRNVLTAFPRGILRSMEPTIVHAPSHLGSGFPQRGEHVCRMNTHSRAYFFACHAGIVHLPHGAAIVAFEPQRDVDTLKSSSNRTSGKAQCVSDCSATKPGLVHGDYLRGGDPSLTFIGHAELYNKNGHPKPIKVGGA
jgi:hypothetical protein